MTPFTYTLEDKIDFDAILKITGFIPLRTDDRDTALRMLDSIGLYVMSNKDNATIYGTLEDTPLCYLTKDAQGAWWVVAHYRG